MKKTIIALAVALTSTFALASGVQPAVEVTKEVQVEKQDRKDRAEKHDRKDRGDRKEKRERKPMTPEQFSEFKAKHINMLNNRQKVLNGEITCAESAKSMDDLKQCFKSAHDARKELGLVPMKGKHHGSKDGKKHDSKRHEGKDGKKHEGKHYEGKKHGDKPEVKTVEVK